MDEIDEQIIYLMRENPQITLKELAKKLRKPLSTIHSRIKKLKENGIIRESKLMLNWRELGYDVLAFVIIFLDRDVMKKKKMKEEDALKYFRGFAFVEESYLLYSKGDLVLMVRAKDTDELYEITNYVKSVPLVKNVEIVLGKE